MKIIIYITILLLTMFASAQTDTSKDSIATKLDEVVVQKELKTFTNKNGNIKIDVANSIFKTIPNTVDLLAKLPKVQISANGESITVIGKGEPLLYIDKQKASMDDLNNLAVDDIKTIEIINNPSVKYESEGRAVILITRKTLKNDGMQLSIGETGSFKTYFNNYLTGNLAFKKKKLEFKFNLAYNDRNQWESNGNDFSIPAAGITSDYLVTVKTKRKQYILGGSFFYKINEDDYFSFSVSNRYQTDGDNFFTATNYTQSDIYSRITTINISDESRNFFNSFLNYNTKLRNSNSQLFTGLQYSMYVNDSFNAISNITGNSSPVPAQNRDQDFGVNVFSARVDLESKFKDDLKWESGALYLDATAKTDLEILDFEKDTSQNSNYKHNEHNTALYTQLSGIYKKTSWSVGLRAENTYVKGRYRDSASIKADKDYTDLFPKLELIREIDSSKTVTLNYSRSISRPDYSATNQGATYINQYFLFAGNINLNPTISNLLSTGFQYKDKSVTLSYYENRNPVYYGFNYDNQQNVLTFQQVNFDKETGFNIEFNLPFKAGFWSVQNVLSLVQNKIEDGDAVANITKPYLYLYTNSIFTLPKQLTLSLTGWGLTKRNEGVIKKNSLFVTDISVSKTFLKNWVCTLSCNDIFHQMNFTEQFNVNNVNSRVNYYTDTREFSVALRYSFGTIKNSSYKEKVIDENSDRIK